MPRRPWKLGRDSRLKLWVRFADGNVRERYSRDWKHDQSRNRDLQLGRVRLERLVHRYGKQAEIARIYDVKHDRLLAEWRNGIRTF